MKFFKNYIEFLSEAKMEGDIKEFHGKNGVKLFYIEDMNEFIQDSKAFKDIEKQVLSIKRILGFPNTSNLFSNNISWYHGYEYFFGDAGFDKNVFYFNADWKKNKDYIHTS